MAFDLRSSEIHRRPSVAYISNVNESDTSVFEAQNSLIDDILDDAEDNDVDLEEGLLGEDDEWDGYSEEAKQVVILKRRLDAVDSRAAELEQNVYDLDKICELRKQPFVEELEKLVDERRDLKKEILAKQTLKVPGMGPVWLSFLETCWYMAICNCVVVLNLVMMLEHQNLPAETAFWLDQIFLLWYLVELSLGLMYFQRGFFIGKAQLVAFHWLDAAIVVSGVLDQWVVPAVTMLMGPSGDSYSENKSISHFVQACRALRLFRLLRLLKLVKSFLQSDLHWLVESAGFEIFMSAVIGFNAMIMDLELDVPWHGWQYVENCLLVVYVLELALKLKVWGCQFFCDKDSRTWNWLDLTIVSMGVLDLWLMPAIKIFKQEVLGEKSHDDSRLASILTLLRLTRLLRVLRLARVLRTVPPLYKLLRGIAEALKAMQWVIVLTLFMLYAGAIVFTHLVGRGLIYGDAPAPEDAKPLYGTVGKSLFSLFRLMNGDTGVVNPIAKNIWGKLLFAVFMILANWAILAILTSVVSDNMITASNKINEDEKERMGKEAERRGARRLMHIFKRVDKDGSGGVSEAEWNALMEDDTLRAEMEDASGLSKGDLHDLFYCMVEEKAQRNAENCDDDEEKEVPQVDYRTFIRNLEDEHSVADKRSVLHVMMRLRALELRMNPMINGFSRIEEAVLESKVLSNGAKPKPRSQKKTVQL